MPRKKKQGHTTSESLLEGNQGASHLPSLYFGESSEDIAHDFNMPLRVVQRVKQMWAEIGEVCGDRRHKGAAMSAGPPITSELLHAPRRTAFSASNIFSTRMCFWANLENCCHRSQKLDRRKACVEAKSSTSRSASSTSRRSRDILGWRDNIENFTQEMRARKKPFEMALSGSQSCRLSLYTCTRIRKHFSSPYAGRSTEDATRVQAGQESGL
ncbi:hypothetical protein B0H19DRAFT_1085420 [Mycena capillaripes]|nr:hypothetical protein B0H19DRAFT_1085420 [Mycena capillaripes]